MSVGKIFLCHSSIDKGYVDHVAHKLGRTRIVYDKLSFEIGHDFRTEITRLLEASSLFVFFASKASIESYWCQYEIDAAEKLRMKGQLAGAMAIIIDHELDYSQLPSWMADLKAARIPSPNAATRAIESSLFAITPTEQHRAYVVRSALQERVQTAAASAENPRMIAVAGLDGIGRRSFLDFTARSVFGMQFGPVLRVDDTHSLEDAYLLLLDETSFQNSTQSLANEVSAFQSLTQDEQCREIAGRMSILSELNQFPCFIDSGGILEEDGSYKEAWSHLFDAFLRNPITCFGVSHRRKPNLDGIGGSNSVLFQFVNPLTSGEATLLLTQLLRKKSVHADISELREILEGLGGYPPAIQVAANYIAEYGVDVLRNSSYMLTDFTARRFLPYIRSLQLSKQEQSLMQYLACERSLSLDVIAVALEQSAESTATAIRRLIDLNIVVNDDGRYSISGPLRDSTVRFRGFVSEDQYAVICSRLTKAFWKEVDEESAPSIDAIDATLHAALVGKLESDHPYKSFVRASTVHRVAQEAYYQKKFDMAEEYAERALVMDPDRLAAESLLAKALIQREKYDEAEPHLARIGARWKKLELYLRGFMAKKRYQINKAIGYFEQAIAAGDDSISVHRDLADCLFRARRLADAVERVEKARQKQRDNPFVLDLAIRIYIEAGNPNKASACLTELEKCDVQQRFIHHCKARLLAANSDFIQALDSANQACALPSQPFEVFAQRIDILIHLRKFGDAEAELQAMEERFPRHRRDIVNGLNCKLYVFQGNWRRAKIYWDEIRDKELDVNQGLLRMILEAKANDPANTLIEKQAATRELQGISSVPPVDLTRNAISDPDDL